MEEDGGLDIMCLNKYCNSSSSSSSSGRENKFFTQLKVCLTEDYPRKNAEILSGQYGTNLFLVGLSLMLAIAYEGASVKEEHLLSFITTLMILQLVWMMWYVVVRDRHNNVPVDKDVHATTCWVRGK